ncbi:MAG: hypothetical protein ACREQC_15785, partial [Candidatus Binataceae bacterium]
TGINGLTQETLLPSDVNSLNQWEQIGYTNSLISSTWISLLAEWAAAFPNTPIAGDHGRGFMPNLSGNPDCTLDLIDTAEKLYPASYILQNNGLSGNGRRLWSEVKAFELDYPNGLIGFQFGAPQGANTQAALNVASANRGRYVEIYPADIMHV